MRFNASLIVAALLLLASASAASAEPISLAIASVILPAGFTTTATTLGLIGSVVTGGVSRGLRAMSPVVLL